MPEFGKKVEYNITEFRANMRQAFNEVDSGAVVIIERYGVNYHILRLPKDMDILYANSGKPEEYINTSGQPNSCHCSRIAVPHSHLSDDGKSYNIRPDIPMEEV